MSPRPWYGPSASFIEESLPHRCRRGAHVRRDARGRRAAGRRRLAELEEAVTVDRGYRDRAHPIVALHAELDQIAGPPRPELLVELFLRGDGDAVDLQDPIALAEPGPRRRAHGRELADEESGRHRDRVEA